MVYTSIYVNKTFSGCRVESEIIPNQELAEEMHKLVIRTFGKWKTYSSFKGNIWFADLADMHLINKSNKGFPIFITRCWFYL